MKVAKTIIQYIIAIILALAILAIIIINLVSSSILNRTYILSKLDEEAYYDEIYKEAQSNFENYINQSGLEEDVLNNIITKEKIEKDTKIIISNIFDGINEQIDTKEISENLQKNIDNSLNRKLSQSEEKSIELFINTICDEYKTTITHTNYEEQINSIYKTLIKYIATARKALLVIIVVCIITIILLTIRRPHRALARIGVSLTIDGLILIIIKKYIDSTVRIPKITILNEATSRVIRNILTENFKIIMNYGIILLSIGVILTLVYGIIKSIRKMMREKEQYNPEK